MTPLWEFVFKALVLAGLGLVWGWACLQFKALVEAQQDDAEVRDQVKRERVWRDLREKLRTHQTTTWRPSDRRGPPETA